MFPVNLCSNSEDKLTIYMENFEKAYIDSTEAFYKLKAPQYLEMNGVQNYMRYAESKLREEEQRANKYLENCSIATVYKTNAFNIYYIVKTNPLAREIASVDYVNWMI